MISSATSVHVRSSAFELKKSETRKPVLNLSLREIKPADAQVVSQKINKKLKRLILGGCQMGDEALKYLCQTNLSQLTDLSLYANRITEIGIRSLITSKWHSLQSITLTNNKIMSQGCRIMTKMPIPQLKQLFLGKVLLNIASCEIEAEGVRHLNKGNWARLEKLDLQCNRIDSKGWKWLTRAGIPRTFFMSLGSHTQPQKTNSINESDIGYVVITEWSLKCLIIPQVESTKSKDDHFNAMISSRWKQITVSN